MPTLAGIGATLRAFVRAPFDFLIVMGISLLARSRPLLYIQEPLYKPIGPNELRLLTIHPPLTSRADELVRCTLHHESLDYTPEYETWEAAADLELRLQKKTKAWYKYAKTLESAAQKFPWRFKFGDYVALSYCWGTGGFTHRIVVNGRIVAVTETLEAALRSVRGDWGTLRLWVDALCINQEDIAERGREVRRMRMIYGDTIGVYVHLGLDGDGSAEAMRLIARMAKQLREGVDLATYVLRMAADIMEGREAPEREALVAVFKLICRPYWGRMWIVQEMAMGDVTLGCGDQGLDFSELRQVLKFLVLSQESLNAIIPHEILVEKAEAWQSAVQILWSSERLREMALLPAEREFTFSELCHPMLRLAHYASATDSRDKVYGALSLLPASLVARIDRQDDNYKLGTREVFMNFARSIIDLTNELDIMLISSLQQKTLSDLHLPSWSPDWTLRPGRSAGTGSSQEWFFGVDERYAAFDKRYNLPSTWSRDPSRSDAHRSPKIRFSDSGDLLYCEGFQIGTISGMGIEIEALGALSSNAKLVVSGEATESPYGDKEATMEALTRTLLLDASGELSANSIIFKVPWFGNDSDSTDYGPEATKVFEEMIAQGWDARLFGGGLSTFDVVRRQLSHFIVGGRPFKEYFPDEVLPCPANASQLEFGIVIANALARRLVTTSTGHVGLAPATVVPGDRIYVLIGCSMPIILRRDIKSECFEVVGECFVDGFMRGEAMARLDVGEFRLKEIVLC